MNKFNKLTLIVLILGALFTVLTLNIRYKNNLQLQQQKVRDARSDLVKELKSRIGNL